jgi:hypothetical protein
VGRRVDIYGVNQWLWGRLKQFSRTGHKRATRNSGNPHSPLPSKPFLYSKKIIQDLQKDIEFAREGTTFSARLETASPVTSLTPTFSFDGIEVTLDDVAQTSGTTTQDFTQILTYRVTNEAGTTEDYQIDLTHFTGPSHHLPHYRGTHRLERRLCHWHLPAGRG